MNPTEYSVTNYGTMINNDARLSAYDAALKASITPGCEVIDIGAGTGVFSLLACKYGAGHVTAIEPAPAALLLEDMARANGFEDRITLVRDLSTEFQPGRRADVIVSDIRGILPLFEHHIATIKDARERLLAPGGALIPARDVLRCALVHSPSDYRGAEEPWRKNRFGLDMSAGQRFGLNTTRKVYLDPEALVSPVEDVATLDYGTIAKPNLAETVSLQFSDDRPAHGLLLWFDAEIAPGIGFSNAPGEARNVYGQTLLPFEEPLSRGAGDRVEVDLKAALVEGSYQWAWYTRLYRTGADEPVLRFRQSQLQGQLIAREDLARLGSDFVCESSSSIAIDARILGLVDGRRSQHEIAETVRKEFPDDLADANVALDHVASLLRRYQRS